jgi:hypothetical protein
MKCCKPSIAIILLIAGTVIFSADSRLRAQDTKAIQFHIEGHFLAQSTTSHIATSIPYTLLSVTAQASPTLSAFAAIVDEPDGSSLDEDYIKANALGGIFRLGRFRTEFGHSDWSELFYFGLPQQPILRSDDFAEATGFGLNRLDTGIDYLTTAGNWQYQLTLLDPHSDSYQVTPKTTNHVAIRAQTYFGGWIIGLNALTSTQANPADNPSVRIYDLDWRWTAPAVQFRGELVDNYVGGERSDGYYADVSYHSLKLPYTTFLARSEYVGFAHDASENASAITIGVKQFITPHYTLELAQTAGNHSEMADTIRGTSVFLLAQYDF